MMNKAATVILIVAVFGAAQGDVWGTISGWASNVGDFFKNNFNKVQDLFASDQTTLEKNVNKTQTLLSAIQSKKSTLMTVANDSQKTALNKVDMWAADLKTFAANISAQGASKFQQHKTAWESKLQAMFVSDNLQSLLPLMNSAGPVAVSLTALCVTLGMQLYLNY